MDYKQTVELERNVKIKNEADQIYKDFKKYVKLNVGSFKNGMFTTWSDQHNATYIKVKDDTFVFICKFLHEKYEVIVNPDCLFGYIKKKYRGLDHLKAEINGHKNRG